MVCFVLSGVRIDGGYQMKLMHRAGGFLDLGCRVSNWLCGVHLANERQLEPLFS